MQGEESSYGTDNFEGDNLDLVNVSVIKRLSMWAFLKNKFLTKLNCTIDKSRLVCYTHLDLMSETSHQN